MIDHEFSTYFMFPDSMGQHMYWFGELERSIEGREIRADEYDWLVNETERHMMEKSATCLHKNLVYIRELQRCPSIPNFLQTQFRLSGLLQTERCRLRSYATCQFPSITPRPSFLHAAAQT